MIHKTTCFLVHTNKPDLGIDLPEEDIIVEEYILLDEVASWREMVEEGVFTPNPSKTSYLTKGGFSSYIGTPFIEFTKIMLEFYESKKRA